MPAIPQKRPGEHLSAAELNAIAQAARAGSEVSGGADVVALQGHAGRVNLGLAPQATRFTNVVLAINYSNQGVVMGQPVEIWRITTPATHAGPYYWHFDWPRTSGRGNLGIAREDIAGGAAGPVYIGGIAPLLVDTDTIPVGAETELPEHARYGCKKHSAVAIYDRLGPFLGLSGVARGSGNQWVYVRITGQRGDYIHVRDNSADVWRSGPYRTIVFGKGYTVTETAPGAISVT